MTVVELTKSRKKLGISQKRLSKMLRKTPTFVCKLENGNRIFTNDLQKRIRSIFAKARKA